ncbi:MAG: signal peptidase I [Bryobacteraceae bacterium]|jgi:signal peptidase I
MTTENGTGRSAIKTIVSWLRDLALSILIAIVVIIFLYQPVRVEGTSMMPGLTGQERIFVNKFIYRFERIDPGDLVVFWYPGDPAKSYIKRVIGVPGDTVEIDRGIVIVNGKPLDEDYVPKEYRDRVSMPAIEIAPDRYFVLGDHRNLSNDSRHWGFVPRDSIYGKAEFVYWPLERLGRIR